MKIAFSVLQNHTVLKVFVAFIIMVTFGLAIAHDPIDWNGDQIHVVLDKENTGGEMGMFTVETAAPGGPARHIHEDAGEAFYLLSGVAEVLVGTELMVVEEGESVYVPKGVEHSFRILSEEGGKILVVVTPAGFEGFFEATKHLSIPEDFDEIAEISAEYGQQFTGPPLGAE